MEKDDFFVQSGIMSNIIIIDQLINTGVFTDINLRVFQEPVFVSIIIKLNDLLQKFNKLDNRISFNDDIISGDITDLVNRVRNAACHIDSLENLLDKESQSKFVFSMIIGRGNAISINGKNMAFSDYEDEIAFFYGENRLYFKRHLIRLINEVKITFNKLYPNNKYPF